MTGPAPSHDDGARTQTEESGVGSAVGRIADRLTGLLRDSSDLFRVAVREEVEEVIRRLVSLALAGIAILVGLLLLGNALALYLSRSFGRPGGFLVVAVAFLLIGAVIAVVAGRAGGRHR